MPGQASECSNVLVSDPMSCSVYPTANGSLPPPEEPDPDGSIAVIVCHGMGEQVPFETLNLVAEQLCVSAGVPCAPYSLNKTAVRNVTLGSQSLSRVEMELTNQTSGSTRTVHLYESYWAPLVEGKISLKEVASFLWAAGISGLFRSFSDHPFDRWMFGDVREQSSRLAGWQRFAWRALWSMLCLTAISVLVRCVSIVRFQGGSRWTAHFLVFAAVGTGASIISAGAAIVAARRTARYLLFALMVFGAMSSFNAVIASIAAARIARHAFSPRVAGAWPSDELLTRLTFVMILTLLGALVTFGVGVGIPAWRRAGLLATNRVARLSPAERWFYRTWTIVGLNWIILMGLVLIPVHIAVDAWTGAPGSLKDHLNGLTDFLKPLANSTAVPWHIVFPVWVLMIGLSRVVCNFLVQYMGDVAIYVSSHTVNHFYETRQAILKVGRETVSAVYGALKPGSNQLEYAQVIVMGHSLGSNVAYDSLNAAINQDLSLKGALRVAERTPVFLTFGSPLDKIAYLFRTQAAADNNIREALAAEVQPMIVRYDAAHRPARWINVWSPDDWISGAIEFYDDPDPVAGGTMRVRNWQDPEACTPGACHTDYWTNGLVRRILYWAVVDPAALGETAPVAPKCGGRLS